MSELKRVPLISVVPPKQNFAATGKPPKTPRISFVLPESTEDKCPEYNYKDELAAVKGKERKPVRKNENGLDPLNDNEDEDIRRIAAEMEEKYGCVGKSKRRKLKRDDYADIGMGYDETDSFIDNTDGYDEIIPKNVTTLHGGFYINCGALEFKTEDNNASSESSSSDEENTPEKNASRKRVLESSDSAEDSESDKAKKNDAQVDKKIKLNNGMQKALKKRLFSTEKIRQSRKRLAEASKKTVKQLLEAKRDDLNMTPVSIDTSVVETDTEIVPANAIAPKEKLPKPKSSDVMENKASSPTDESSKDSTCSKENLNKSDADVFEMPAMYHKDVEVPKLPENLSGDILDVIDRVKKEAACNTEGKVKFFSGPVKPILLSLERKCKCLGKQSRNRVYEHLAPFVRCRKETLMKRAKNLLLEEELKKVKEGLNKLKMSIDLVMPAAIESYETQMQKYAQEKLSKEDESAAKELKRPRRKFPWNEQIKKILKDTILIRKRCCFLEGKRKDNLELSINHFLKSEVYVLFPEGWISMTTLIKCSAAVDVKKPSSSPSIASTSSVFTSSDITLSPHTTISPIKSPASHSPISISSNSSLTITPVIPSNIKPKSMFSSANNSISSPPKKSSVSPPPIRNSTNNNDSIAKLSKALPEVDIIEATPEKADHIETVIIGDSPIKTLADVSMIDLTGSVGFIKKKPGPKSKTEKHLIHSDKPKVKKEKEVSITSGSTALNQIITESLNNSYAQRNCAASNTATKEISIITDNPSAKPSADAEDIEKVMEDLRVLQKLSSPVKVSSEPKVGSPVSVIAFNKSYSSMDVEPISPPVSDETSSSAPQKKISNFQDAFQKQFIHDFNIMKASQTSAAISPPKGNYNSTHMTSLLNGNGSTAMFVQNQHANTFSSNNPHLKTHNFVPPQSGSHTLLDDMLANLLRECGQSSETANKSTSQPK